MGTTRNLGIRAIDALFDAKETVRGLMLAPSIANAPSYCEGERKPYKQRLADCALWALRHHEPHDNYNYFEWDIAGQGTNNAEYLDNHSFIIARNRLNLGGVANQAVILRDKRLFFLHMELAGIATPFVQAVLRERGEHTYLNALLDRPVDPASLCYPVFVKAVNGECGQGVFRVCDAHELQLLELPPGDYIVQSAVVQHPTMAKLGTQSVNTCRIITTLAGGSAEVFSAIARCGCAASGYVDNTSAGGLAVGVTEGGRLQRYGYYNPGFGGKTPVHPDTGITFQGFQIPFYEQAADLVKRAHYTLPGVGSIGWDVAISPDGPVLVEGNDNWEIHSVQICNNTGLRKRWERFVALRMTEQPPAYRHLSL